MRVLGIETSCDETGVALYCSHAGLLAHAVHSQVAIHAAYGGVVPELASRDHVRKVLPLIRYALTEAKLRKDQLDGIAYTRGPGLVGALLVGASVGRALAWGLGIPALGIHHMEGHLLSPLLEPDPPSFPFVALLVSGGHTQLVQVTGVGRYHILGRSVDDAVGEAFDKVAKLLGLGYPGGPAVAHMAEQGHPTRFKFPRPMITRPGLDFSFSGLKTSVLHALRGVNGTEHERADIARGFEEAVVETLTLKCQRALEATRLRTLVVAGGVGANLRLRRALRAMATRRGWRVHYPRAELCTDNGAMIAFAGLQRLRAGQADPLAFGATPRWPMETLSPIDAQRP